MTQQKTNPVAGDDRARKNDCVDAVSSENNENQSEFQGPKEAPLIAATSAVGKDAAFAPPAARAGDVPSERTRAIRRELFKRFPEEFKLGVKAGFTASGKYPTDFHQWQEVRRNAWWAGWNVGHCDRVRGAGKGGAR
jgi:hypothetical protein